jgi:hypothetical protein
MKAKLMLGLAGVALLASCGLIKTPPITIQDTTKTVTPGSGSGGGALGIDGKGAPLSLVNKALVLQAANTNITISSGTFEDVTDQQVRDNVARLAEWGFTQTMPQASLSGANCPASFSITGTASATSPASFTATISDSLNGTARSASTTVNVGPIVFTAVSNGSCDYNATVAGLAATLSGVLTGADLATLGAIITTGGTNTGTLKGTFNVPASVEGRTLTLKFGGSSSYVVATIL